MNTFGKSKIRWGLNVYLVVVRGCHLAHYQGKMQFERWNCLPYTKLSTLGYMLSVSHRDAFYIHCEHLPSPSATPAIWLH